MNYRQISLLDVPGKFFEKIIDARLCLHLESSDCYYPLQSGFRQSRGTSHALAVAIETVAQYKADRGQCHIVIRDITNAFDKVWHLGFEYKSLHLYLVIPLENLLCNFR